MPDDAESEEKIKKRKAQKEQQEAIQEIISNLLKIMESKAAESLRAAEAKNSQQTTAQDLAATPKATSDNERSTEYYIMLDQAIKESPKSQSMDSRQVFNDLQENYKNARAEATAAKEALRNYLATDEGQKSAKDYYEQRDELEHALQNASKAEAVALMASGAHGPGVTEPEFFLERIKDSETAAAALEKNS